jgi:hypothetical protein
MFSNDKYNTIIIILVVFILFLITYNCIPSSTNAESFESVQESVNSELQNSELQNAVKQEIISEKFLHHNINDIDINIPIHLSEKYVVPLSDQTKDAIATNKNVINDLLNELKSSGTNQELINDKINSENMKISNIVKAEYLDNLSDKLISEGNSDDGNLIKQSANMTRLKAESLIKMDSLQELVTQELAKSSLDNNSTNVKKILTEYYHHLYKLKEILKYISILNDNINDNSFDLSASKLRNQENKIKLLNSIEIYKSLSINNKLSDSDTKIIEGKINKIMDALKNSESSQEEITDNKYNTLIKSEVSSSNLLSSNNVPIKSEIVHSNNLPKSKSVHFDDLILPINNQEKNIVDGYDNNNNLLADNRSYEYDAINKKKQIFSKIVGFDNHDDYDNYLL